MRPKLKKIDESREYMTPERCRILELNNDPDDEAASIARARVAPGVSTEWHELRGTVERYLIVQGEGCVEVGGLPPSPVKPGDVVIVPEDTPQRITNTSEVDLVFFCICTPRFQEQCYVRRRDLEAGEKTVDDY